MAERGTLVKRQQISPTPLAYRVPLAAALIGIAPATLWRLIAIGDIPARKIGSATVIRHADLQTFIDATPILKTSQGEANPENGGGAGVRLRKQA